MKSYKSEVTSHKLRFLMIILFFLFAITYNLGLMTYNLHAQEEFKYDAQGKRNPFIPLVTSDGRLLKLDPEEEHKSAVLLEGIIYDKRGLSYAIVNGAVVRIGDTVGDYQVLKIEERKVVLIKEGQIQELELKKEEP